MPEFEHVYLGCELDESGTGGEQCFRKVAYGRRFADEILSLVLVYDLNVQGSSITYAHDSMGICNARK